MGLEQFMRMAAKKHPDKTAVVFKGQRTSYRCLEEKTASCAGFITKTTKPGDTVLILARNCTEQIELILACFESGRIACPVNWRMSPAELASVIAETNAALCVYDQPCMSLYCDAAKLSHAKLLSADIEALPWDGTPDNRWEVMPEETYAIRYYTSGSTGTPKSVLHTHGSMMRYFQTYSQVSEWGEDTIYETQSNLFHLSGFSCLISVFVGGTLVLMDKYREEEFFRTMEQERCTRISLVPTLIARCLTDGVFEKYDFTSVDKIVYGGSPLPMSQVRKTIEKCHCKLEQAYGTTETCNISVLGPEDHQKAALGLVDGHILESAGRPIPGVQVKIINEDGSDAGEGEGEVVVKSPFLLSNVAGNVPHRFTEDGFYCTGDIGKIEKNYIYLIDRKNDMIVSGGENIYPREVENCIAHMVDDVSMVAVVGGPDPIWGEEVVAFVVRYPGSHITEDDVIEYCRQHIAGYKKPKRVIFLDKLPLNANGKTCRRILKDRLVEESKGNNGN